MSEEIANVGHQWNDYLGLSRFYQPYSDSPQLQNFDWKNSRGGLNRKQYREYIRLKKIKNKTQFQLQRIDEYDKIICNNVPTSM